jgi:hypothetical protein
MFVAGRTAEKIRGVADAVIADGGLAEPVVMDATLPADAERLLAHSFTPGENIEMPTVVVFNAENYSFTSSTKPLGHRNSTCVLSESRSDLGVALLNDPSLFSLAAEPPSTLNWSISCP